mmetsp:Transcript_18595/g.34436  ORF Transcript_18595/g.34436 Transcript_18595/m.34436 type:complete len:136 (+) Transcript_18595:107-514(+)
MPHQAALRIGEGAHFSVLISRLHPNKANDQRLTDLKAVRVARTSRRGHIYNAVFFTSKSVPRVKLFCASRYAVVVEEGFPDCLWGEPQQEKQHPWMTSRTRRGTSSTSLRVKKALTDKEEEEEEEGRAGVRWCAS